MLAPLNGDEAYRAAMEDFGSAVKLYHFGQREGLISKNVSLEDFLKVELTQRWLKRISLGQLPAVEEWERRKVA